MGGEGSAYGAFIGAALIFVIRNALLMAGVDSNWQGDVRGRVPGCRGLSRKAPRKTRLSRRSTDSILHGEENDAENEFDVRGGPDRRARWRGRRRRGGRQEDDLRAGAEEHQQPVLRPGARRLQEGREGTRTAPSSASTSAPASMAAATSRPRSWPTSSPRRSTASWSRPPTRPPWPMRCRAPRTPASRS